MGRTSVAKQKTKRVMSSQSDKKIEAMQSAVDSAINGFEQEIKEIMRNYKLGHVCFTMHCDVDADAKIDILFHDEKASELKVQQLSLVPQNNEEVVPVA